MRARIERFDATRPVERARTPPSSWYVDGDLFALEARAVFARSWQAVAGVHELDAPGAYAAGTIGDEPFVVVRDGERLRAFWNVCRHHATCLVDGRGRVDDRLVCPYHGWAYDLAGRLRSAPRMGGVTGFDRAAHGLLPMHVATWGPLVLVRPDTAGPPVAQAFAPLDGRVVLDGLTHVARRSWDVACNWKVVVDNYLDGGYHVEHLHRGLAARLDLDAYRTEIHDRVSLQTCPGAGGDTRGDARIGAAAVYAFVYPNLMINRYGPVLDVNVAVPVGPGRTRVVFDWWFEAPAAADRAFVQESLAASAAVQDEDTAVCEAVQRGLRSSAFRDGPYAPRVEAAMHAFHTALHADLLAGLDAPAEKESS